MSMNDPKDKTQRAQGDAEGDLEPTASAQPEDEKPKATKPLTDEEKRRRLEALARRADRFFWQLAGLDLRRQGGNNDEQ